jgi:hypothetical protein
LIFLLIFLIFRHLQNIRNHEWMLVGEDHVRKTNSKGLDLFIPLNNDLILPLLPGQLSPPSKKQIKADEWVALHPAPSMFQIDSKGIYLNLTQYLMSNHGIL